MESFKRPGEPLAWLAIPGTFVAGHFRRFSAFACGTAESWKPKKGAGGTRYLGGMKALSHLAEAGIAGHACSMAPGVCEAHFESGNDLELVQSFLRAAWCRGGRWGVAGTSGIARSSRSPSPRTGDTTPDGSVAAAGSRFRPVPTGVRGMNHTAPRPRRSIVSGSGAAVLRAGPSAAVSRAERRRGWRRRRPLESGPTDGAAPPRSTPTSRAAWVHCCRTLPGNEWWVLPYTHLIYRGNRRLRREGGGKMCGLGSLLEGVW